MVRSVQGVLVLVETLHYGFPVVADACELLALVGKLIPDVLSLEDVLIGRQTKTKG